MSRQSAYRLRARLGADFGRVWEEGLEIGAMLRRDRLVRDGMVLGSQEALRMQGDTRGTR